LESQGLLKSEWETEGAKPRKYYVITEDGKIVFEKIKEHWGNFSGCGDIYLQPYGEV